MEARSHDVIAPRGQDVLLVDGSSVRVRPFRLGQLPRFVEAVRPAFGALVALAPASSSPGDEGGQGANPLEQFLDLFLEHQGAIAEILEICAGLTPEAVAELELDDAYNLVMAVWDVNQAFFVQRVLPLLRKGLAKA